MKASDTLKKLDSLIREIIQTKDSARRVAESIEQKNQYNAARLLLENQQKRIQEIQNLESWLAYRHTNKQTGKKAVEREDILFEGLYALLRDLKKDFETVQKLAT